MKGYTPNEFDELSLPDHSYLRADDNCVYYLEYTPHKGFNYSAGNQFIFNLKKSPPKRGTWEYNHKLRSMREAAETLRDTLPNDWLADSTFVPIPPSKERDDPEYDDRMTQILRQIGGIDVRELVYQRESMEKTHHMGENRHTLQEIIDNYEIDEDETDPEPAHIVIVDDVVTAGKHFKAMEHVLGDRFPGVQISGVFLARRVFAADGE
jgi:hypothetical protein